MFNFKKMKNLENYGVQELNANELKSTNGGFPWIIVGLVALVTVIASTTFNNSNKKCKASSNCNIGPSSGGGGGPRFINYL